MDEKHGIAFFSVYRVLPRVLNATDPTPIFQVALYASATAFLRAKFEQNNSRVSRNCHIKKITLVFGSHMSTCSIKATNVTGQWIQSYFNLTMQSLLRENTELLDTQVADILSLLESHSSQV